MMQQAELVDRHDAGGLQLPADLRLLDENDLRENQAEDNGGYGYFVAEMLSNEFKNNASGGNALGGSNQPGSSD